jgi:hypothetical protein
VSLQLGLFFLVIRASTNRLPWAGASAIQTRARLLPGRHEILLNTRSRAPTKSSRPSLPQLAQHPGAMPKALAYSQSGQRVHAPLPWHRLDPGSRCTPLEITGSIMAETSRTICRH